MQFLVVSAKFTSLSVGLVKLQKAKSINPQILQTQWSTSTKSIVFATKSKAQETSCVPHFKENTIIKIYTSFQCFCILQEDPFNPQMDFRLFHQITFQGMGHYEKSYIAI